MKKTIFIFILLYLVYLNFSTIFAATPAPPDISATAAIVMDATTGFILYEKNINEPRYPASLAKIMTALIALEQYSYRLYEPITFTASAVYSIPPNSSHIAMNEGETLSMEDALYGLMLASANEVANAIAEHISGDISSFADLMTRRAGALGAANSQFSNPSGLHNPNQFTTAYDLALITREALRHPKFIEVISTSRYDIPPTERQPQYRELLNSNRMIRSGPHFNGSVIGGKTGFTDPARHTLVTYASHEGRELIVVTLEGAGNRMYTDTTALLNYGFDIPYEQKELFTRGEYAKTLPVYSDRSRQRTQIGEVRLVVPDNVHVELPVSFDISEVEASIYTPPQLVVPIQSGQYLGRVVYSIRGLILGDVQLRAANTILPPSTDHHDAYDQAGQAYGLNSAGGNSNGPNSNDANSNGANSDGANSDGANSYGALSGPMSDETYSNMAYPTTGSTSYPTPYSTSNQTSNPTPSYEASLFSIQDIVENYYLSVLLPIVVFFAGLLMSVRIFRVQRNKKQAKSGRYSVIGSQVYRNKE